MDLRHDHGALIHVVRACDNADASDIVAIGGENSVSVLIIVCAAAIVILLTNTPRCSLLDAYRPTLQQTSSRLST